MNILTLTCNIGIPVIMIFLGHLYQCNLYKKIDNILDLIMPMAMLFTGFSDGKKTSFSRSSKTLALTNKKCGLIWSISGVCTLILAIIFLILNHSISIALLEFECLILVAVFATVEYISKRTFHRN
ncbi:hypothetical protein [Clostridium beijerinckii]|uniref:Uncharacterized protein n=1 Tax=Clostridium beijerinckii TaxID=1520 RepID=A0AAE5LQ27_CLOBE|nr:hypothetical protein [Clostridium beijerinckii]NSB14233.1 hypothetical protein [Clostridium beijerinckii]OOM19459.1 hypothetical protein CLOBE_53160 [Clostridium beijerinckii]